MTHATTMARRAFLAAALLLGLPPNAVAADEMAVMSLQRRRDHLLALLDETAGEEEVARLCGLRDDLAAAISRLPTSSLAVARIKLLIVSEGYVEAHTSEGFDRRLFNQVLEWMGQVETDARSGRLPT